MVVAIDDPRFAAVYPLAGSLVCSRGRGPHSSAANDRMTGEPRIAAFSTGYSTGRSPCTGTAVTAPWIRLRQTTDAGLSRHGRHQSSGRDRSIAVRDRSRRWSSRRRESRSNCRSRRWERRPEREGPQYRPPPASSELLRRCPYRSSAKSNRFGPAPCRAAWHRRHRRRGQGRGPIIIQTTRGAERAPR